MGDPRALFYGAESKIFELAKENRNNLTESKQKLWSVLRNNLLGVRFRSQHPIGKFIEDFYCHKYKLIIERDGEYHKREEQKELDQNRTDKLNNYGLKVIRFTNKEVESNMKEVISAIKKEIRCESAL